MAIVAVLIVLMMTVLDVTVVNVALPVLAERFGVGSSTAVWVVTVYQLVITMLLLPFSSAGDLYSYRRMFLTGVGLFTAASAMCAASTGFAAIVAARALQGIGAACVMSVNIALTRLIYPREILGRGLALNAMVVAISSAAGPTLAGTVLSVASWHWLFLINVPFGIAAFCIGRRLLPHNPPRTSRARFDYVSAVANMLVFGLVFFALGRFTGRADAGMAAGLLAAGLAIGVFYVRRQLHRESPLLPVDLFRSRVYSLSVCTATCSFVAQMTAMVSIPFMFVNAYGFSAITTGLLMTPWPLTTMVISPLAARYVERHSAGATAAAGMAVFAAGAALLLALPQSGASEVDVAWRMAVCGLGFGMFQTPNNIVMMRSTPLSRSGGAGGVQSTARLVGQTFGSTLVTIVFAFAGGGAGAVHVCLYASIGFAIVAGVFSISRGGGS